MWRVASMDSFTHCGTNPRVEWGATARGGVRLLFCVVGWVLLCWSGFASAQTLPSDSARLQRSADGLFLTAKVELPLSESLQDALTRGVALHFVWQAELRRSRWYWSDKRVSTQVRVLRVAYQPLTRRWRVGLDARASGASSPALQQSVDSLEQAMAMATRVSQWPLATAAELQASEADHLVVSFRLESAWLPRGLMVGGDAGAWERTLEVPPPPPASPASPGDRLS